MSFISLDQLPVIGMSYEFVGAARGAPISAYIVNARPGQELALHTHPDVEVVFTLEGRANCRLTRDITCHLRKCSFLWRKFLPPNACCWLECWSTSA